MKYLLVLSLISFLTLTGCINEYKTRIFQINCPGFYNGTAKEVYVGRSGTSFTDSEGKRRIYPPSVKCEIVRDAR